MKNKYKFHPSRKLLIYNIEIRKKFVSSTAGKRTTDHNLVIQFSYIIRLDLEFEFVSSLNLPFVDKFNSPRV